MINDYKEIILTKFHLAQRNLISLELLGDPTRLEVYLNDQFAAVELNFRKLIAAQEVDKQEVKYPTTWWDAFKERWYPIVLRKFFPVNYTRVVLDAKLIYPELIVPNQKHRMLIMQNLNTFNEEFDVSDNETI